MRFIIILYLNAALALPSDTNPKSFHNPILPVHLTEHNILTLALATLPEMTPSASMSVMPHHKPETQGGPRPHVRVRCELLI